MPLLSSGPMEWFKWHRTSGLAGAADNRKLFMCQHKPRRITRKMFQVALFAVSNQAAYRRRRERSHASCRIGDCLRPDQL